MKKLTLELQEGIIINLNKLNDLPLTAIPDLYKKVGQLKRGITTPKEVVKGFDYKSELLKLVSNTDIVNDYITVGKLMKRAHTKIGLQGFINECDKYKISYELGMRIAVEKNWRGFKISWLKPEEMTEYGITKKVIVKKEKPITMDEIKKIMSDDEKILLDKRRINEAYIEYMDNLQTPDLPTVRFNSLVEYGVIKIASNPESNLGKYYQEKTKEAVEILKEKHAPEKALSLQERTAKQNIIKLIDIGKFDEIEPKMKELVLIEFFNRKIKDGANVIFEL